MCRKRHIKSVETVCVHFGMWSGTKSQAKDTPSHTLHRHRASTCLYLGLISLVVMLAVSVLLLLFFPSPFALFAPMSEFIYCFCLWNTCCHCFCFWHKTFERMKILLGSFFLRRWRCPAVVQMQKSRGIMLPAHFAANQQRQNTIRSAINSPRERTERVEKNTTRCTTRNSFKRNLHLWFISHEHDDRYTSICFGLPKDFIRFFFCLLQTLFRSPFTFFTFLLDVISNALVLLAALPARSFQDKKTQNIL